MAQNNKADDAIHTRLPPCFTGVRIAHISDSAQKFPYFSSSFGPPGSAVVPPVPCPHFRPSSSVFLRSFSTASPFSERKMRPTGPKSKHRAPDFPFRHPSGFSLPRLHSQNGRRVQPVRSPKPERPCFRLISLSPCKLPACSSGPAHIELGQRLNLSMTSLYGCNKFPQPG